MLKTNSIVKPYTQNINQKKIDFGNGDVAVSLQQNGLIHSLNTYHPKHGYMTMSSMENFPNDKWYDSDHVRNYRKRIAENEQGFGFQVQGDHYEIGLLGGEVPTIEGTVNGLRFTQVFTPIEVDGKTFIAQRVAVQNPSHEGASFPYKIGGTFSVGRSSYGQLTEGGPLLIPDSTVDLAVTGNHFSIKNEGIVASGGFYVFRNQKPIDFPSVSQSQRDPIQYSVDGEDWIEGGKETEYLVLYHVQPNIEEVSFDLPKLQNVLLQKVDQYDDGGTSFSDFVIDRNYNYIMNCCSVPTSPDATCLITDHQFLPLSWNRDAYFMVKLLFDRYESVNEKEKATIQHTIKSHIKWMFHVADRPEGYWGRSYLTNGYCKDHIFQLDQQCYPLLELCDYVEKFKDLDFVQEFKEDLNTIIEMLLTQKHEHSFLFRTEETPADDDVEYPYHFSSQLLVWQTFRRLAELNHHVKFSSYPFGQWVDQIEREISQFFVTEKEGRRLYAYLTDLNGNYRFYHDANDLPSVLAPEWGFCEKDDQVWLETMKFAFSTENEDGYYEGNCGGLGSVHTRHAWPLGFGQELLFGHLTNDKERIHDVIRKLEYVIQTDGLYSEAVDEHTGKVTSRQWFSWPGAFISSVLIQMRKER